TLLAERIRRRDHRDDARARRGAVDRLVEAGEQVRLVERERGALGAVAGRVDLLAAGRVVHGVVDVDRAVGLRNPALALDRDGALGRLAGELLRNLHLRLGPELSAHRYLGAGITGGRRGAARGAAAGTATDERDEKPRDRDGTQELGQRP